MQKCDLLIQNTIVMTNYETVQMGMDIAVAGGKILKKRKRYEAI